MERVFLLLGTNLGNRARNLSEALRRLEQILGKAILTSSVYETEAWGKTDQPAFYNQVLAFNTILSPTALLEQILSAETAMGRRRGEKWGERLIDIDILLYGHLMIREQDLEIPHPRMHERRFTLVPFGEIAPEAVHPVFSKTIKQLLEGCSDTLETKKL